MKNLTVVCAAGETRTQAVTGRYLRIMTATGPLKIQVDNGSVFDLELGVGVEFQQPFTSVQVFSATSQTVVLAVADVRVDDNRLVGNVNITGGLATREQQASSISAAAVTVSAAATLVDAANTARLSLLIQAIDGDVFIGGATVTAAAGVRIAAGSAMTITTTAAVYAITASGSVNVRKLAEVV